MVAGVKLSRDIAARAHFTPYRGIELYPGPEAADDQSLARYIRESCHTANAMVGTCRMGAEEDSMAVVDTRLRVKGVGQLRVVDSSVMPLLPGGQAGAPTMMIAERAADFIKAEHKPILR
mmetsp:Transcript_13407/g.27267  ORF Transcript_13407/g.27267 Transcript_13407/m.27267 type:complete len:120 (+) Transcript_13407:1306-1665(+)